MVVIKIHPYPLSEMRSFFNSYVFIYRFDIFSVGVWLECKNWFLTPTEKIKTLTK